MRFEEIARVEVVFEREPGGPRVTAEEVAAWVRVMLGQRDFVPNGSGPLQYATARVTRVQVP
jgi:hypothetical protein